MVDTRTPEQRRRIMTAVRSANTAPEVRLRRALYAAGIRGWRCHYKGAPGKPDLAWPSLRVALFVDGAFWHGHLSRHKPGRSGAYWDEKIARNVERDRQTDAALESNGWTVVRAWDFEIARNLPAVVERVTRVLRQRAGGTAKWHRRLTEPRTVRAAPAARDPLADGRYDRAPESSRFGQNLRDARYSAGLSQGDLAQRAGIDRGAIDRYERGARQPKLPTILKLAHALGVAPETLMSAL